MGKGAATGVGAAGAGAVAGAAGAGAADAGSGIRAISEAISEFTMTLANVSTGLVKLNIFTAPVEEREKSWLVKNIEPTSNSRSIRIKVKVNQSVRFAHIVAFLLPV